jgi:glycosyltransferase involved in cell wall biosynthesis
VPAFNASPTIDETLASVRAQSWRDIEIIVVDDGSTDDTAERVERHAREDARVRLFRKPNEGVASARNLGIAEAHGALVAPVDADDLWAPTKIERQMAALAAGGERVALVYTRFALIDETSSIVGRSRAATPSGQVLRALCRGNFVGNGSSPLMRRDAVLAAGGYDAGLHAQDAQGCEDLKLYLEIAERHDFAVVPDHLTGYRTTVGNMSSHWRKMLASFDLVMAPKRIEHPELVADIEQGRGRIIQWLFARAFEARAFGDARALFAELYAQDRAFARRRLLGLPTWFLRVMLVSRPRQGPFLTTLAGGGPPKPH